MLCNTARYRRGGLPALRSSVAVMRIPAELYNSDLYSFLWETLCPDGLGLVPDLVNDVVFFCCSGYCRSHFEAAYWWKDAD